MSYSIHDVCQILREIEEKILVQAKSCDATGGSWEDVQEAQIMARGYRAAGRLVRSKVSELVDSELRAQLPGLGEPS